MVSQGRADASTALVAGRGCRSSKQNQAGRWATPPAVAPATIPGGFALAARPGSRGRFLLGLFYSYSILFRTLHVSILCYLRRCLILHLHGSIFTAMLEFKVLFSQLTSITKWSRLRGNHHSLCNDATLQILYMTGMTHGIHVGAHLEAGPVFLQCTLRVPAVGAWFSLAPCCAVLSCLISCTGGMLHILH